MTVRRPHVAGSFYPADPARLHRTVAELLERADPPAPDVEPRMLIVPHAGYIYSGPVAASAYRHLPPVAEAGTPMVLMGPSHFVEVDGVATPEADRFETPLGSSEIDQKLRELAESSPWVAPDPHAHRGEHSLEVQLPFLQHLAADCTILPLLTGGAGAEQAAEVLDSLLEAGAFAIISSDLSHYLEYERARRQDAATAAAIVELREEDIGWRDACGRIAVRAALLVARSRGWRCSLLDLRNSGDTAGPRDQVVGYGAFVLGPPLGG